MPDRRLCRSVIVFTTCCLFISCARYKPKSYVPPSSFKKQYLDDVTAKTLLTDYNNMLTPTPSPDTDEAAATRQKKVDRRNRILTELIALIDQNYSDFENRYYGADAAVNFGGDVANLGLTARGASPDS